MPPVFYIPSFLYITVYFTFDEMLILRIHSGSVSFKVPIFLQRFIWISFCLTLSLTEGNVLAKLAHHGKVTKVKY